MKKNWAYLAFELMQNVFPYSYRPQVRNSVVVRRNSKVFKYKFVANQNFSKTINARQISMLVEVNPSTVLLFSRSRFMFLNDY